MSGVYDKYQAALDAHLRAFATAQAIDVAWENAGYEPVVGTPYLESTFMPILPDQATVGGRWLQQYWRVVSNQRVLSSWKGFKSSPADGRRHHKLFQAWHRSHQRWRNAQNKKSWAQFRY